MSCGVQACGNLADITEELQVTGATSLTAIAAGITVKGIATARGKGTWSETQVSRVIARLEQ